MELMSEVRSLATATIGNPIIGHAASQNKSNILAVMSTKCMGCDAVHYQVCIVLVLD